MSIPPEQAATAAMLAALTGAEPHETHISAVFVGEAVVFKLRKAVRLSFVDFTALAERERTARREFELNAPHAPGLYRAVLAVVLGADGTLALGGAGEVVDWVVAMAPVPGGDFLDVRAGALGLDATLLDALADAVAAYHDACRVPLAAKRRDPYAAIRAIADGNANSAGAAGLPEREIVAWRDGACAALGARHAWLCERAKAGFVRRAHGDLHLGNLCLWRGGPVLFDALEFDEDLATIDVAYDLAFLLMDLAHRLGRPAANRVLARYVARTGDHGLAAGLPVFMSMRAFIRAHVEATRGHGEAARAYLDAAHALLTPAAPVLVAIGGLPGTGKSTIARLLAPELGPSPGALILRSDEIRKRRHGAAPEQRLPQSAYGEQESRRVLADLTAAAAATVAHGHAAVADATFMDVRDRAAIAAAAGQVGFVGLWLQAPLAVLEQRVASRRGDASDATLDVLRRAAAADPGPGTWIAIDAIDSDAAVAAARAAVGCSRAFVVDE